METKESCNVTPYLINSSAIHYPGGRGGGEFSPFGQKSLVYLEITRGSLALLGTRSVSLQNSVS